MSNIGPRAIAGFLVMLAAACSSGWSGPGLRPVGTPNLTMAGSPEVTPTHHMLLGEMILCLTAPGRAVITAVRPIHLTGTIDVVDFAVRLNPALKGGELLGSGFGTLRANGFPPDRTVDVPCGPGDSGQGYELALELSVPPGTNAAATGWEIDYRVGDHTASTTFPQGVVLCSTPTMDTKPCEHLENQYASYL